MIKTRRFILALLLCTAMLFAMASAVNAEDAVTASGSCGANVTWTLYESGKLTISGTGPMANYTSSNSVPWYSSRSSVKTVEIAGGVTSIGSNAFYYCSSLGSVTIPSSVTSIGDYAFYYCSSLGSVTIPSGVTSIGYYAFYYCSSLGSVTIPSGVTSISNYAFSGCSALSSVTIPSGVTSIGERAFAGCALSSVTIPSGVTSIGNYAFSSCSSLGSVTIPSGVTSIGAGAFGNCGALTEIKVNSANTAFTAKNGALYNKAMTTLVQVPAGKSGVFSIPSGVTRISESALGGCSKLTGVTIPNTVTAIHSNAFVLCSGLTSLTIPSSVTSIGSFAFDSCSSLTKVVIPTSVTTLGSYVFYHCDGLTSITVPSSVTDLGNGAFYYCTSLKTAVVNANVTEVESQLFSNCVALESVTLPAAAKSIGSNAFSSCRSLASITIPSGVTRIGSYAFSGCKSLASVTVPAGVKTIDGNAFANCSALKTIDFAGGAPTINGTAFKSVTATAYYPENDSSWTEGMRQNYGGTLTWQSKAARPSIITQPEDLKVAEEDTARFSVSTYGSGLGYQWYYQKPGATSWTKISGATAAEYSFAAQKAQNGYKYKCVVSYSGGTIESRAATLTVTVKPPKFVGMGDSVLRVAAGQTVTLKVTATGEELCYHWINKDDVEVKTDNSGAATSTYSFTATADSAGEYYCVVENPGGHDVWYFKVQVADIPKVTDPAEDLSYVIIPEGSNKTLKVTASGSGLNYEWWQIKNLYSGGGESASATRLGSGSSYTIKSAQAAEMYTEVWYMCLVWNSKYNDQHAEAAAEIAKGNIPGPNADLGEDLHIAFRYFYVGVLPKPIITAQPVSTTVNEGEKASFTVTAAEKDIYENVLTPSYQWYYQKAGETTWNKVTLGGTSATYKFTTRAEINGYKFKCVVSNIYGVEELGLDPVTASVTSKVVTLTVRTKPAVTTQPKDVTVVEGGSAGFTVKASGEGLSYQWQCRSSSTGSWVNCAAASAKTATHSPASLPKYSGYQYRCKISNSVGTVYSKVVTFTVVSKPVITTQPKSITVNEGAKASFTVKATGTSLSYQWYCRSSATADWVACAAASAKTATHSPASLPKYSGYQYKCVVKSTVNGVSASVTSSIVTLTVNPKPSITAQPKDVEVQVGETASFSITAKDASSYQWYYLKPGESTWNKVTVKGTAATYTLTAAKRHDGYTYRCVVTNSVGSVTSENATLTIIGHPAITTQPKSLTVNEGSTAKFSVEATGGGLKYHWFYQKPGESEWTAVKVGGDGASYTLTTEARHNGYKYKCRVKNIAGTVYSSVVTLTVNPKPVITTQPKSVTVNAGEKATFKVAATGATSYQWYYLKPGETEWTKVSKNGTSAIYTLTTAARHNGYKYKCVVTNSAGSVTSSTVKLTVK